MQHHARRSALTSLLYGAVILLTALHMSYFLEYLTTYIENFTRAAPEPEDRGDLIRSFNANTEQAAYPTLATLATPTRAEWNPEDVMEAVPVVMYFAKPGVTPCSEGHYVRKTVEQAQKLNHLVFLIGPEDCKAFFEEKGVRYEPYQEYEDVFEWFVRNVGSPLDNHVRWFILKRFLEKHDFARVFYLASEVMLFANVTELAAWMFPSSHIVLPARWPSLRPPPRTNQYISTAVAGHTALFSYEGLADWCRFLLKVFELGLFGGIPGSKELVFLPQYNDMIAMGWYTFAECWLKNFNPPCMAEQGAGISGDKATQMRGSFSPKFRVESFCHPRMCQNSTWSNHGYCVFDNNFSITTVTMSFRFSLTDKCPTSLNYAYYEAWLKEPQRAPVQFLAVHFQGKKKEFLTLPDENPAHSWGGSNK